MLKGQIYITNDINMISNAVYTNTKVVALAEGQLNVDMSNVSMASILLPPYGAVMAEMDGNIDGFYAMYWMHLSSKEADQFINLIIAALARGINILLYVPKDESALTFVTAFMQYMTNTYGIAIGTESAPCQYNNAYNALLCSKLYIHDFISYEEFFVAYPAEFPIVEDVAPKLIFEMGDIVPLLNGSGEYLNFFNSYKNRIKQNSNRFLTIPIIRGRRQQEC